MGKCKTPGATYTIVIHNGGCAVTAMVTLPDTIALDAEATRRLKRKVHDAFEGALADFFKFGTVRASLVRSRHTYMVEKSEDDA
jgi:hypothetical protein